MDCWYLRCRCVQPLISVSITWYRTRWRQVWLQLYSPAYLFPQVLWSRSCWKLKYIRSKRSGGAAPADIQYSQVLNMRGQIAGATPLSQLFIYMNNCLQFWDEHSLKISAPYLFRFGIDSVRKIFGLKDRSISHAGDCRTAPTTPGLLKINFMHIHCIHF